MPTDNLCSSWNTKVKTIAMVVLLAIVTIGICSCGLVENEEMIELGEIKQGDSIKWSVELELEEEFLFSLSASDEKNVWTASFEGNIYHFDGRTWSDAENVGTFVRCLYTTDRDHVWAGGEGRITDARGAEHGTGKGLVLYYDGSTWTEQFSFQDTHVDAHGILKIAGNSTDNIWAISKNAIFHLDGRQWQAVYTRGDGSALDQMYPELMLKDLLVGEDGIPLVYNSDGFHYYQEGIWIELPALPEEEGKFRCIGMTGSLSSGVWVSGPIWFENDGGEKKGGLIYYWDSKEWEKKYECEGDVLGECVNTQQSRFMVAQYASKRDTVLDIELNQSKMIYFNGDSWSEQGMFQAGLIYVMDSTNTDTIWLTDGWRILKGVISE